MKIYKGKIELTKALKGIINSQFSIGLVPTMGALHEGHLTLVKKALNENTYVVVSIFVNPTQFDNASDLDKYPRTLNDDVDLLKTLHNDTIFIYAPTVEDIYEGHTVSQKFDFDGLEDEMEGKFRKGHFDGVGTVVKRLFEIVNPNKAYFGEKDFQQLAIIKKLTKKYNIPVEIIGVEISREPSGLARSSRNMRLKPEYEKKAPFIYKTLRSAKKKFGTKSASNVMEWVENQFAKQELLNLEYFTIADEETLKPIKKKSKNKKYRAFIAAYADDVRLIDNIALN